MGYPAHMSDLVRTASGSFTLENCMTFEELEAYVEQDEIQEKLLPIEQALNHLPKLQINDKLAEKVKNGAVLPEPSDLKVGEGPFLMMDSSGTCLAIYEKHSQKEGLIKPTKVLAI